MSTVKEIKARSNTQYDVFSNGKASLTGVPYIQCILPITEEISQLFTKGLGRPCSLWRRPTKLTWGQQETGKKGCTHTKWTGQGRHKGYTKQSTKSIIGPEIGAIGLNSTGRKGALVVKLDIGHETIHQ